MGQVDELDHRKDDQCDQQEVDDALQEGAVADSTFRNIAGSRRDHPLQVFKIDAADDHADHRHDDIVDQGIDNGRESRTDDNTDSQINDVAARNEYFELMKKTLGLFLLLFQFYILPCGRFLFYFL